MSDKREDLPVSVNENNERLAITIEDLQSIWDEFLVEDNDRRDGEFTKADAAGIWNMQEDTVYDRLERMVKAGKLEKRFGRMNGRRATFYKKTG